MNAVRVRALARAREVLPGTTTCAEIDDRFQAEPDVLSEVIALDDGVAVVGRRAFYQELTGRLGYGRTLLYRRSVSSIAQRVEPLDGDQEAEEAALALLGCGGSMSEDLLVSLGDRWGTVPSALLFSHAATIHRRRAEQVAVSERRLRALVENARDVTIVVDLEGRLLYRSRVLPGMEVALGEDVFRLVHPDDVDDLTVSFHRSRMNPDVDVSGEFRLIGEDGATRLFEYNGRNLLDEPAIGGVVVNFRDITDRRFMEDQLRHHAHHDALTGLANREQLSSALERCLSRLARVPASVSLLYCDLDGFKAVNDDAGHAFGDEVLIAVADRLRAALRRSDLLARIGGDEFVVLLDGAGVDAACELAERLVTAMRAPFVVGGRQARIGVSVGVSTTVDSVGGGVLLQQADSAMYVAKSRGRDQIATYDPVMHQARLRVTRLSNDLRVALGRGELYLAYQPIVDLVTDQVSGVEALLRWDHPELGAIPPAEFVPVAESHGLIAELGRWVVQEACDQLLQWDATGLPALTMSVNVAPAQLDDSGLVTSVERLVATGRIEPSRLQLELTESAVATTGQRAAAIAALHRLGVRIAIDDFGTGFSSLSSFGHLPVDVVKLDRSFLESLVTNEDVKALVGGIIDLARRLGYRTIAEGVEREDELAALRAMGCDAVQGFLLARPMPPGDVAARVLALAT